MNIKKSASAILAHAVKNGTIEKLPCQACGTDKRVAGHHYDYSKPLSVLWLCSTHHAMLHQMIKVDEQRAKACKM